MHVEQMIASHPHVQGSTNTALVHAIEAAMECAQTCRSCADACLGESEVQKLTQCIRLDLDCADVCAATADIASRRTGSNEPLIGRMLKVCSEACRICAEECARHAGMHAHCRICQETCEMCEAACRDAARSVH